MVPAWQIVFTTFGCGYIVGVTHMIAAVFFIVKVPTARALNSFRRSKCKRSHMDVRRSAQKCPFDQYADSQEQDRQQARVGVIGGGAQVRAIAQIVMW